MSNRINQIWVGSNKSINPLAVFTFKQIVQLLEICGGISFVYDNGNKLEITTSGGCYYKLGQLEHIQIAYLEEDESYLSTAELREGKCGWTAYCTQYFPTDMVNAAIDCFIKRTMCDKPLRAFGRSYSIAEISEHYKTNKESKNEN